jgi:hypothetical protein
MNKYQLYTLGGALLGATSLAGTASAGTVGVYKSKVFSTTAVTISNAAFSTTASTANGVLIEAKAANTGAKIAMAFTNSYDSNFNLNITVPITGASFSGTPDVNFLMKKSTGSYGASVIVSSDTGRLKQTPSISALASTMFIQNLQLTATASIEGSLVSIGGLVFNDVTFTNASGLATSGGTIALQASIASQNSSGLLYETVPLSTIATSAAPLAVSVSGGAATVAVGTAPSQFTTFSTSTSVGSLSLTLATVSITSTGAVGTDLSIPIDADGANGAAGSGSVSVTVSSAALSDAAVTKLYVTAGSQLQTTAAGVSQFTPGVFTSGTVTFTLTQGSASYDTSFNVILAYDGSTAISAVSTAGTVTATLASGNASVVSAGSGSGSAATISRGGLSTEVSWANAGTGSGFTSYVRIHNKGSSSAAATIVVTKDTTDGTAISTLGTVTTGTIAAGGTIQVGVPAIESSLGINSSTASGSYTLRVSGGFPGYVQHLSYNGSSLFDLSGFRNGSDGTASAP